MKVLALPLTAVRPIVAVGFAPDTDVPPTQVPFTAKHPAVRFHPFAPVEVADVDVMLRAVDWIPAEKVEVALPRIVVVAVPPT